VLVGIYVHTMSVVLECPPDTLAELLLMLFGSIGCLVAPFPLNPDLAMRDWTGRLRIVVGMRLARQ
jgi:hypothetical protein